MCMCALCIQSWPWTLVSEVGLKSWPSCLQWYILSIIPGTESLSFCSVFISGKQDCLQTGFHLKMLTYFEKAKAHVHWPCPRPASVQWADKAPGNSYQELLMSSWFRTEVLWNRERHFHCVLPDVYPTEAEHTSYYIWGSLFGRIRIWSWANQWLNLRRIWSHLLALPFSPPQWVFLFFSYLPFSLLNQTFCKGNTSPSPSPSFRRTIINLTTDCQLHLKQSFIFFFYFFIQCLIIFSSLP